MHARYSRHFALTLDGWVYSEQRELMLMYLAQWPTGPAAPGGAPPPWVLDFEQDLFHPNDGWWLQRIEPQPDGSIYNRATRSRPPFLHYNGPSKVSWAGRAAPAARALALRRAFEARQRGEVSDVGSHLDPSQAKFRPSAADAAGSDAHLRRFFRERVAFVGMDLARRDVPFSEVCPAEVGDARSDTARLALADTALAPWGKGGGAPIS